MISEFSAQNLANTAWAFAKMEMRHEGLIAAVATRGLEMKIGRASCRERVSR